MAQVGYIRVSSADQNTARQLEGLALDRVFEEKASASTLNRPIFNQCLAYLREGDMLHIHSLDRVCRSGASDAVELVKALIARGVGVSFSKEGMTFNASLTAAQEGLLGILGAVAKMERSLIRERQLEGIAAAKKAGKHLGRPAKTINPDHYAALKAEKLSASAIASELKVSRASLYRWIAEQK
ncbi:recombinase family protein [Pseudomonas sp. NPDC078700]|uniref:recombinase family protein n=1 Tax=Pseudomonas sp. NPDC078700 TaxID=3364424 RepID=UPI0037C56C07